MDIKPYQRNAKKHSDKQILQLAKIVKEVGWRQPVVVNQQGTIVAGHGRWMAWEKYGEQMGLKEIWVMDDKGNTVKGGPETSPLTEEQERAWRIADNAVNLASGMDISIVAIELKELSLPMAKLTGYDPDNVLDLTELEIGGGSSGNDSFKDDFTIKYELIFEDKEEYDFFLSMLRKINGRYDMGMTKSLLQYVRDTYAE